MRIQILSMIVAAVILSDSLRRRSWNERRKKTTLEQEDYRFKPDVTLSVIRLS